MSETPTDTTTPDSQNIEPAETSLEEAGAQAVAMSLDSEAKRRAAYDEFDQSAANAAKTLIEAKEVPQNARRSLVATGAAVAGAALLGAGFAHAADAQAQYQQEQGEQMQQEQEQIDRQLKFENGLDSGSVTIEVPEEQQTLPSPEQK